MGTGSKIGIRLAALREIFIFKKKNMKRLSADERRGVVMISLVALLIGLLSVAANRGCGRSITDREIKTIVFVRDSVAQTGNESDSLKKERKKKNGRKGKKGNKGRKRQTSDKKKRGEAAPAERRDLLSDPINRGD